MARPHRIEFPGALYLVTSKGTGELPVFQSDEDRFSFLNIFKQTVKRFNWRCHAYCLMDDHYHIVIETVDGRLAIGMRQLNGVYTQQFNRRYQRSGHVFQGRYKAVLFERDRHLLEICRHVVLNPIRAGAVGSPEQYRWSSYRTTAGFLKGFPALSPDRILRQFAENPSVAQKQYRRFVLAGIDEPSPLLKIKAQCLLGSSTFVESFITALKAKAHPHHNSYTHAHLDRPLLEKLFVPQALKGKQNRNRAIASAHLKYGYSLSEIGNFLGLHYSTVSKIAKQHSL